MCVRRCNIKLRTYLLCGSGNMEIRSKEVDTTQTDLIPMKSLYTRCGWQVYVSVWFHNRPITLTFHPHDRRYSERGVFFSHCGLWVNEWQMVWNVGVIVVSNQQAPDTNKSEGLHLHLCGRGACALLNVLTGASDTSVHVMCRHKKWWWHRMLFTTAEEYIRESHMHVRQYHIQNFTASELYC